MNNSNIFRTGLRKRVWAALDQRFAPRYKAEVRSADRISAQTSLIRDNCWLLTHEKSGTTYLCNILAFNNAIALGIENDVDFDSIHLGGVFRDTKSVIPTLDRLAVFSKVNRGLPLIIHTHQPVDAKYRRAIMLTRNVFDYCISAYKFRYENRNRNGRNNVSFDDAIPELVGRFTKLLHAQIRFEKDRGECTIFVRYEDLILKPEETVRKVLNHFEIQSNTRYIKYALAAASHTEVQAHEKLRGKPIVAGGDFTGKSFIRSGAIGEYREVLSRSQINKIEGYLYECGLSYFHIRRHALPDGYYGKYPS